MDKVKHFLLKHPKTRDNDDYLIKLIWYYSCEKPEIMTAMDLLKMELPKTESIVRMRRKLQEENESLRGLKYLKRMKTVKKVKMELKEGDKKWVL